MGIIYDLWETQKPPQKKILGVGYSSTYLTNEDKNALSYKLWMKIMSKCFSQCEYQKKKSNGKKYEFCNSWLDYQKFAKWFKDNYKECHRNDMVITKCVISKDNTMFNPNNCAIVPKEIFIYLERANPDTNKARTLAEKYKDCIMDDIYELLTEEY